VTPRTLTESLKEQLIKWLILSSLISSMFESLARINWFAYELAGIIGFMIKLILCYCFNFAICVQVEDLDQAIAVADPSNRELSRLLNSMKHFLFSFHLCTLTHFILELSSRLAAFTCTSNDSELLVSLLTRDVSETLLLSLLIICEGRLREGRRRVRELEGRPPSDLVEVWVDHDAGQDGDSHNQSLIEKISEKSRKTMVVVMNPEEEEVEHA